MVKQDLPTPPAPITTILYDFEDISAQCLCAGRKGNFKLLIPVSSDATGNAYILCIVITNVSRQNSQTDVHFSFSAPWPEPSKLQGRAPEVC